MDFEISIKLSRTSTLTSLAESTINGTKYAHFPSLALYLDLFFLFPHFIIYIFVQLPAFLGL